MTSGRVVSLLASGTEIVCALGVSHRLVGISHECDYPPHVLALPRVTKPSFPCDGRSDEIDAAVRERLNAGLPLYEIDTEQMTALRPEIVITQAQCEVCAIHAGDVERACAGLMSPSPSIVSLQPRRFGDLYDDIERVAASLNRETEGLQLVANLRDEVSRIHTLATVSSAPPARVLYLEWLDPLMVGGNWMPDLIAAAGGNPLLVGAGERSRTVTIDEIRDADPDLVVIAPCGYPVARTCHELTNIAAGDHPGFAGLRELRAFREKRAAVIDGNALLNRSGPRLVDSILVLAEVIAPELFPTLSRGISWVWAPYF